MSGTAPCQHTAIEILLGHRADVNVCERSGWSALMHLAAGGDVERIKLLFAYSASMKASDEGFTALMAVLWVGMLKYWIFFAHSAMSTSCSANKTARRRFRTLRTSAVSL